MNVTNFILSLGSAMAAAAGTPTISVRNGATGGNSLANTLSIFQAVEDRPNETGPYSVLRPYGGAAPEMLVPVPELSIQCMTVATLAMEAVDQAQQLYESLFGTDVLLRHHWTIAGKTFAGDGSVIDDIVAHPGGGGSQVYWEIRLVKPASPPGIIGVDKDNRTMVSFNFNVRVK